MRLETNATGTAVTGVVVERDGARETYAGDIVVVSCGAANSAKLLLASASDAHPRRAGQRLGPGRAQLHVPQQPGRAGALQGAEPDGLPEDARAQRLLLRAAPTSTTRSATSRWSASRRREMYRGEKPIQTKLAPERTLEQVAEPRRRLLALDRGPPAAGEPRDAAPGRAASRSPTRPTNDVPKKRLYHELKSMLGHLGMHPDHLLPRHAYLKNEIPVAGVAHQAGTCRFGADPATLGAQHRLPGARGRQPLRRRHELLPEHRRGQPGADGDGERAAGRRPHRSSGSAPRSASGSPRMSPETANGQRHVVVVGGGFAGVGCAQRLAEQRRRPRHAARPQQLPPVPAAALPGGDLPARAGDIAYSLRSSSTNGRTSTSSSRTSPSLDPATRTVTTADGARVRRRRARARGGLAAELLPHARARDEHAFPLYSPRRRHAPALADPRRLRGGRPRPGADRRRAR